MCSYFVGRPILYDVDFIYSFSTFHAIKCVINEDCIVKRLGVSTRKGQSGV